MAQLIMAFILTCLLTPVSGLITRKLGVVSQPRPDRWHKGTIPMLGGTAIFAAMMSTMLLFLRVLSFQVLITLGCGSMVFVTGLIDDIRPLPITIKLFIELLVAVTVVGVGIRIPIGLGYFPDSMVTVIWIIGITNAFNLLDNMDGLAAGIAAATGSFLAVVIWTRGLTDASMLSIILAASCLGFLIYNFYPAKVFMGDCGSLFLGFLLAVTGVVCVSSLGYGGLSSLGLLGLFFTIPIADTFMVSTVRYIEGRSIFRGGIDHLSHRLVARGSGVRKAVHMLWGISICYGMIGSWMAMNGVRSPMLVGLVFIPMFWFCVVLAKQPSTVNSTGGQRTISQ